jgi:hypothetical protein
MSEQISNPELVSAAVPVAPSSEEPVVITGHAAVANVVEIPAVNGHSAISVPPLVEGTSAEETGVAFVHPATKLRRRIEDPSGFVFAPGVYDGLSARVALEAGFETLYMVSPICWEVSRN